MANFSKNIQTTGDLFTHHYTGVDVNTLTTSVDKLMLEAGYRLVEGNNGNGVYEKGNRTMRLLFGAFVKYFKMSVKVKELDVETLEVKVVKYSSGFSGGLIGISQVKKELLRLANLMAGI